jgi:hypothetical protein
VRVCACVVCVNVKEIMERRGKAKERAKEKAK